MGADTSSTQLVFFIAATTVAAVVSGILAAVAGDLAERVDERGRALGAQLATDVQIANDPAMVPNNPLIVYVKNTGQTALDVRYITLLVDGAACSTTVSVLDGAAGAVLVDTGDVAALTCNMNLAAGDHHLRVLTENGVADDLKVRI